MRINRRKLDFEFSPWRLIVVARVPILNIRPRSSRGLDTIFPDDDFARSGAKHNWLLLVDHRDRDPNFDFRDCGSIVVPLQRARIKGLAPNSGGHGDRSSLIFGRKNEIRFLGWKSHFVDGFDCAWSSIDQ